ncbi:MAG: NAD(P)/FAD-dependent oxidoreductase, partial [Candidatus Methanomethylophilaceae archaeon]|nr:NAD(P)/FAD-dependent oxidoreductase [Candidatus Methanomethylophilaceae archaeon]
NILSVVAGAVSKRPGIPCSVGDGIMAAGDAARVINPLTGGGIRNALRTGKMAGEVAAACIRKGDVSKESLMEYDRMWRGEMEDELLRYWRMKERYVNLSDDVLDKIVFAVKDYDFERLRGDELKAAAKAMCPELFGSKRPKAE